MYNCTLESLRGYSYKLPNSIINCPDYNNGGIIMPLANSVQFFDGEVSIPIYQTKREISAIDMKNNFIGIGQKASPGQLISAVLLDTRQPEKPRIFNYQKTQINHIGVSSDGQYLCSVGSSNQLSEQLVIIQVNNQSQVGTKIFYQKAFKKKDGRIMALKFSNTQPNFFVLLCVNKVIFYRIDSETETVQEVLTKTSKVREFNNIIFSPDDKFLYGCSKNGDITQISVQECKQTRIGPRKRVITKGITNIKYINPGYLGICGKEGLIALVELKEMKLIKQIKLQDDEIISLSEFHNNIAYIATSKAIIYKLRADNFETELFYTCHSTRINSLAFLKDFSDIFGTCSGGDIIIWKTKTLTPTIKISLRKITCLSLHFPKNGKYIISGWSDDGIRIFSPKNGKLLHRIEEANLKEVTEIISDQDSTKIICGGKNGVIRLWNLLQTKIFGLILGSLAFHMKEVHAMKINPFNFDQLISVGEDGYFAVWSLSKFELLNSFCISNYLKDLYFVDQLTIRVAGAGSSIYECHIANGFVKNELQANGTYMNSIVECYIDITGERLLFYGGDLNYLNYFDLDNKNIQVIKVDSFGQIVKVQLCPDKANLIAITANGIILKYSIFAIKKNIKQDEYW